MMFRVNSDRATDRSLQARLRRTQPQILFVEGCLAATLLICWRLASPAGLSAVDLQGFLLALTPLAIASVAQTFPLLAGGQGLSAGATLVLVAATVATWPLTAWGGAGTAIVVGLALGATVGAVNGFLIGFCRLRSMIVTLAVGAVSMAFALQSIDADFAPSNTLYGVLLGPQVAGISIWPIVLIVGLCFLGEAALRTESGRSLRQLGAGGDMPERPWLLFWAYVLAGLGASVGGIFLAAELGPVDLALGAPLLLQILAAAALGGSAPGLRGGTVFGSLIGAIIITAVGNLFIPFKIPDYFSSAIDAGWLLIGFSLCALAERGRSFELGSSRRSAAGSWLIADLSLLSPIVLLVFNFRPAVGDLATVAAGVALLGVGQAAVIRTGTIDLSMSGLIAFSSTAVVALGQQSDVRLPYVLAGLFVVAIAVGSAHTWLARRLGRAAIAATLATSGIAQAAAAGFLVMLPAGYAPPSLTALVTATRWFGVPPAAWVMSAMAVAIAILLSGRSHRSLGFLANAIASLTFGVVVAGLSGSVHYSQSDTYALPAIAAALLTSPGLRRPFAPISLVIPIAYGLVIADTALVSCNVGYAGRIFVLAVIMICGEALRVASQKRRDVVPPAPIRST